MSVERELAVHETEIKHLQADMDKLVQDMESIKVTLNAINSTLAEARGGWRVLMMVGGAGGALGALVTQYAHKVFGQENNMGVFTKKVKEIIEEVKQVKEEVVAKEVKETPTTTKVPDGGTSWLKAK